MAGINNNLGNFNLRNSLLKNNAKKAEVKDDVKQKETTKKGVDTAKTAQAYVKAGDINTDSLLAMKGIKIGKQVDGEFEAATPKLGKFACQYCADGKSAMYWAEHNPGDLAYFKGNDGKMYCYYSVYNSEKGAFDIKFAEYTSAMKRQYT